VDGLKMQARIVSAARGARWLGEGWQLFRAAPLAWLALACAYLLGTNILALVPVVGFVAALLIVPALTVGMMAAARAASHGTTPTVRMLFDGFRGEPGPQLGLGAVYFACSMLVFGAMALADPEGKLRAVLAGRAAGEPAVGELLLPIAVFALAYAPVLMMFWFAPPLAAWHSTGVVKGLFFSLVACLLNWRAFLAYGAAVALMLLAVPLAALLALKALAGASLGLAVASLVFPLLLLMLPTLFASFYVSYRDVFGVERP
jgi:hypothetical protein